MTDVDYVILVEATDQGGGREERFGNARVTYSDEANVDVVLNIGQVPSWADLHDTMAVIDTDGDVVASGTIGEIKKEGTRARFTINCPKP